MTNTSQPLVLVTGATGFVGSAITRIALSKGYRVRVLVRKNSSRLNLEGLDVEICVGDMCDPVSMKKAMQDVRYLFHAAADYRLWVPDPEQMIETNQKGTEITMQAALDAQVECIIYTSSVATLKASPSGISVDETAALTPKEAIGVYKRSKVLAERSVEKMIKEQNLPAIIVHPSAPIGPRDLKPTPTGKIILDAARGKIPAYIDTGLNLVHVDDLAQGHFLALEKGKIGEHYILGGDNVPLKQMLKDIARLSQRKAPKIQLPRQLLYPIAIVAEAFARLINIEPFMTVDALDMTKNKMYFSSEKAQRELGYQSRSYLKGIEDALNWFEEQQYLR